jgi:hypothetical protein
MAILHELRLLDRGIQPVPVRHKPPYAHAWPTTAPLTGLDLCLSAPRTTRRGCFRRTKIASYSNRRFDVVTDW